MRGGGKRGDQKNFVCVLSKKEEEEKINSKKKNFRSTLFTSTHTANVQNIVVPSSVFILHENKNNRVLRIRILRMTEVPTKVVAFEKENVSSLPKTNEENNVQKSSKGVPNLPSPPSPSDEIQNDELDEEEEEEEHATIEEAAIEKMKEQNDDKEEEEEEEDFIRIKRRVRGTNEKEEEEEEVIDDAADIDAKKTNDKEEEEREDVNNNNTVEKSFKKKTLKHKSGERVEKVASKTNTSGQGDEEKAEEGDKFEFELEEEEEEEMEEDDDEERILERRFAETGRLSEDEEEDEESESELNFSSSEEEENESSSDSEVEDNEGGRRRRGGRKTTKKGGGKKKKAIDPNDKEAVMRQKKEEADEAHEKLMRKTAKHVHFPGYRVQAERTSFLPVIEKLQNNLRMVENDENLRARYPRPPPSPEKKEFQAEEDAEGAVNDGVNEEVSEDEGEDGGKEKTNFDEIDDMDLLSEEEEEEEEEMVELEEESDSDDEVAAAEFIRKSLSAKKTMKVVVNDPAHAEDKDNTAKENQDDEDGDEDDGELSEEEDMTGKERREQRKLARNFYKEDRKNQKKERRSKKATEGVDDEAEMSEDGGHTDDDDEDDIETARAEIDEMADFVDFREGTALDNDERRNEARRDAHAKREFQEDEEYVKKMKELVENGFKRPKRGLNGEEDDDGKWKTRRTQERGDDSESESDSDDLRNLRPEEAVEVSDDEDEGAKAFKERQAQRFSMKKASGGDTQEPNENEALPEVDVSMEVMKLFEKEKNKKSTKYNNKGQGTTQSQTIASDLSNRGGGGSGSGLSRGNSQFSNLGAARTSSTSFLKRNGSSKSQSGFAKGIISGGAASRTFVFGSALDNSNSQWATTQRETETMPSSLGNNLLGGDEARTGFGDDVANNNINSSASVRENKKKSLFSMLQKSTKDEDWEKGHEEIKNVLGM